jgi:RNA polymerase sigma-70 factor (ECF subfamily)
MGDVETRQGVVLARRARTMASGEARAALAAFCEASRPIVHGCIRGHGYRGADAEDLTQAYFARFLERGDLEFALAWRGGPRGFLQVSVRHFLANEWDRRRARKRGSGVPPVSLDAPYSDREGGLDPACTDTPESLLVQQQAQAAMDRAVETLRRELARAGCGDRLARVERYLLSSVNTGSYGRMAREWGVGESAVRVMIHRLRRRLSALLRNAVSPGSVPPVAKEARSVRPMSDIGPGTEADHGEAVDGFRRRGIAAAVVG